MGARPQKTPTPNSQVAQDMNKQKWSSKMSERTSCKPTFNTKRTIKRKSLPQKWKKNYENVLQPKADIQGKKILPQIFSLLSDRFAEFWKKNSPKDKHLVRKLGTEEIQVIRRMKQRQFTLG